jgi:hypothetical protein
MTEEQKATLQVIWEQLNGALFDITDGDPADAQGAIEDSIIRLEVVLGIHAQDNGEQP